MHFKCQGLCQNLKARRLALRAYGVKVAGKKKRSHKWVPLSFTVNSFLPYLRFRLTAKIFLFSWLSTKFLAVLRLSVNAIETLF